MSCTEKIFISFEAFERIRLKDETITAFEQYIRSVDESFAETDSKKKDEGTQGKLSGLTEILGNKTGSAPYLEELGVDSIVIDEAHAYKNSSALRDFKGAKFLSVGGISNRGIDAQAKAWFIRGMSDRGDGVLLLTATPITNSPLEVYSMMSLAVGHERVNNMALGVRGADEFMNAVCIVEDEEEETIDGQLTNMRVFKGLNNSEMMRGIIADVATIKTAEDVGAQIVVPDEDTFNQSVSLDMETKTQLQIYKGAYRYAMDKLKDRELPAGIDQNAIYYDHVAKKFGETDEVIAHPFNLINKMTLLIADPDLDARYTKYVVGLDQGEALAKVVTEWNKNKPIEEVGKLSPNTMEGDFTAKIKKNEDTGNQTVTYKVKVRVWDYDENVYIDSVHDKNR